MRRKWAETGVVLTLAAIALAVVVAGWSSLPAWGTGAAGFFAFGFLLFAALGCKEARCPRCQQMVHGLMALSSYARCASCQGYFQISGSAATAVAPDHVAERPTFAVPLRSAGSSPICCVCAGPIAGTGDLILRMTPETRIPGTAPYCREHLALYGGTTVVTEPSGLPFNGDHSAAYTKGAHLRVCDLSPPASPFAGDGRREVCLLVRSYAFYRLAVRPAG